MGLNLRTVLSDWRDAGILLKPQISGMSADLIGFLILKGKKSKMGLFIADIDRIN